MPFQMGRGVDGLKELPGAKNEKVELFSLKVYPHTLKTHFWLHKP